MLITAKLIRKKRWRGDSVRGFGTRFSGLTILPVASCITGDGVARRCSVSRFPRWIYFLIIIGENITLTVIIKSTADVFQRYGKEKYVSHRFVPFALWNVFFVEILLNVPRWLYACFLFWSNFTLLPFLQGLIVFTVLACHHFAIFLFATVIRFSLTSYSFVRFLFYRLMETEAFFV